MGPSRAVLPNIVNRDPQTVQVFAPSLPPVGSNNMDRLGDENTDLGSKKKW